MDPKRCPSFPDRCDRLTIAGTLGKPSTGVPASRARLRRGDHLAVDDCTSFHWLGCLTPFCLEIVGLLANLLANRVELLAKDGGQAGQVQAPVVNGGDRSRGFGEVASIQ
jgi:hypothetical protein